MIDISRQKQLFPLTNFDDVEKLFEFNIDETNGEPNLALLSIVTGLIEHSLVTVTKEDLAANSRQVTRRKDVAQKKFVSSRHVNASASSSSHQPHLSSTSSELTSKDSTNSAPSTKKQKNSAHKSQTTAQDIQEFNEAAHESLEHSSEYSRESTPELTSNDNLTIPEIDFEVVETLYRKFADQFKSIDAKDTESLKTNLKIKKISDSVWEHLSNSYYKDKAHLQSLFSYLSTSKLDCFGLAFAVIAGCQIINLKNIYLALSEDHAWVMFDLNNDETKDRDVALKNCTDNNIPIPSCAIHGTCEVTWHGKANSDKRGQPVTYKNSWLYTNGYAVRCDTRLCVAALVNSINASINSNTDSETLALLQQRLLWMLFHKKNYFPMSLGNLGELEDLCPTPAAPLTPYELFNLGIEISRVEYNDSHVYPYTYLASFLFNHGRFKEALETWADSSAVMTKYNYSRDDEEIYKEFFEVANELIPSMLKVLTAGGQEPSGMIMKPFLQDPDCLALILKLYDNICCWEEGSSTPVLHIGWAKNFVNTVLKFNSIIRSKIKLLTEEEWDQNKACATESEVSSRTDQCSSTAGDDREGDSTDSDTTKIKPSCDADEENMATRCRKDDVKGPRKRTHSFDNKVDTSESVTSKKIKQENVVASSNYERYLETHIRKRAPPRDKRIEVDGDNNVTVILRSRKIAGVRDLLQAERFNKNAIELQLTAQSQCAVRGRSNSSSYTSEFISSVSMSVGGSTRSKRLQR